MRRGPAPWFCRSLAPFLAMGDLVAVSLAWKLDKEAEAALLQQEARRLWRSEASPIYGGSVGARCRDGDAAGAAARLLRFRRSDRGCSVDAAALCAGAHAAPSALRRLLRCRLRPLGVRVLKGEGDGRLHIHDDRARPLTKARTEAVRRATAAAATELVRVKTCRGCYERRGALMPTADAEPCLLLECHSCSRSAVVARDAACEWLRWARSAAWDKLNVVGQDFGVTWHCDPSPRASRARARSADGASRGLRALASARRDAAAPRPHCASDGEDGD